MTLLLILNAYHDAVKFLLPKVAGGRSLMALVEINRVDLGRHDRTKQFQLGTRIW